MADNEIVKSRWYRVQDVIAILGVSDSTVRRLCKRGVLDCRHIGRGLFVAGYSLRADPQESQPEPVPLQAEEPQRKRRPLGHELRRNGGAG